MLSIVIPTLNEEKYLPRLIESIKRQGLVEGEYEIIVSDANSTDKTIEIARQYGCRVVEGGGPAKGKNNGALVATGDVLFFIDADSILPDNCLKISLEEYKKKNLQIATFMLAPEKKHLGKKMLFDFFYNFPILVMEKYLAHGAMAIMMERNVFEKINGFDESVLLAEDHHLARRADKIGKFGIIRSSKAYICDRRFKKEGYVRPYAKYVLCEAHMLLIGPARSNVFRYGYSHLKKIAKIEEV